MVFFRCGRRRRKIKFIGRIADINSLEASIWVCGGSMAVALIVSLFYKESAPAILAKRVKVNA